MRTADSEPTPGGAGPVRDFLTTYRDGLHAVAIAIAFFVWMAAAIAGPTVVAVLAWCLVLISIHLATRGRQRLISYAFAVGTLLLSLPAAVGIAGDIGDRSGCPIGQIDFESDKFETGTVETTDSSWWPPSLSCRNSSPVDDAQTIDETQIEKWALYAPIPFALAIVGFLVSDLRRSHRSSDPMDRGRIDSRVTD